MMMNSPVLVLNRSYMPVHITDLKRALCLLYRGLAKAVDGQYELFDFDSWAKLSVLKKEDAIGTVSKLMRAPRVILLDFYDRVPDKPVRFSRLNIFLRDANTCQYCARQLPRSHLNLDHVIPLSQGGKTTWENVVCSCILCNLNKGGRSPEQANLKLIKTPIKPHWSFFFRLFTRPVFYDEWKPYLNLIDYSYWNVELQ